LYLESTYYIIYILNIKTMDQVTVTTKNSFGWRIKKSLQNIILWIFLIIAMIGLLYRN